MTKDELEREYYGRRPTEPYSEEWHVCGEEY